MVKIGIISDTHDNQFALRNAVKIFFEESVEYIFHCGDFIAPFSLRPLFETNLPLRLVFGNNDGEHIRTIEMVNEYGNGILEEILLLEEISGKKIAMTHGHHKTVLKSILESSIYDLILSGHDHLKKSEIQPNGSLHVNPGEAGGWINKEATIATIDLTNLDVKFFYIDFTKVI